MRVCAPSRRRSSSRAGTKTIETVVQERSRYQIVEKVNRKVVDVVEKLDPRGGEPDLEPG
jgi:hypothetical protein